MSMLVMREGAELKVAALTFETLCMSALPAAWLLTNHHFPWASAWLDGFVLWMLTVAACSARGMPPPRVWPRPLMVALCVAVCSVTLQLVTGQIWFLGDAVLAGMYLSALALAVVLGLGLTAPQYRAGSDGAVLICMSVVIAALVSVGMACAQWLQAPMLYFPVIDLPPNTRPFANLAQPNHFSSVCLLGICALGVLAADRVVGRCTSGIAAFLLLWGVVISGSRTGVLQLVVLMVALLLWRHLPALPRPRVVAAFAFAFITMFALWQMVPSARLLEHQAQAGPRLNHWATILDAIAQRPWAGYGWQQLSAAQFEAVLRHPVTHEPIEHAHNIVLDLMAWAGVPVGLAIVGLFAFTLSRIVRRLSDGRGFWLIAPVAMLLIHGLLEYPLEYAYFLVPFGLYLGAAWRHTQTTAEPTSGIDKGSAWPLRLAGGAFAVLLTVVSYEYVMVEQATRVSRLESIGVRSDGHETPAADFVLLTQQKAFLQFVRTPAREGMTPEELAQMREVVLRYPFAPSQLRYALALGLSGQAQESAEVLRKLCWMQARERCEEGQTSWGLLQQQHPQLRAIPYPPVPR